MRDVDVRVAVRSLLAGEHLGDDDTRIVEEMGIWNGAVRVDLAVINGEMVGYEIKSAKDTLSRLPAQATLYNSVFDRVYLVAAEKHVSPAIEGIPAWWGILLAVQNGDGVRLERYRHGAINRDVDPIQVARLLWRDEALAVLEQHQAARGVRSATREKVVSRLADILDIDELRREVRNRLKRRETWLGQPVSHQ